MPDNRPTFGINRPSFGLAKETPHRMEIAFWLKSGGTVSVTHDLGAEVTEASFGTFVKELQEQVRSGHGVATFADSWSDSGQLSWLDLAQVAGFAARPLR